MAQLRCYMNLLALNGDRREFGTLIDNLQAAGFSGVQFAALGSPPELSVCRARRMGMAASDRVNVPKEAAVLAERAADHGYECLTLHAGWGLENDDEAAALID